MPISNNWGGEPEAGFLGFYWAWDQEEEEGDQSCQKSVEERRDAMSEKSAEQRGIATM